MRYINSFNLSEDDLGETFYICPKVNLNKKTNEEDYYAFFRNNLSISNLISAENPNITAVVKNVFNPINNNKELNILFDIDTNLRKEYTLSNAKGLEEELLKLKEFKNHIFFYNFKNAYEEFK